eukprot:361880-Chlamydomonas_euryale.AAC.7
MLDINLFRAGAPTLQCLQLSTDAVAAAEPRHSRFLPAWLPCALCRAARCACGIFRPAGQLSRVAGGSASGATCPPAPPPAEKRRTRACRRCRECRKGWQP